jgi:phosphatidate cytidylyltransferase
VYYALLVTSASTAPWAHGWSGGLLVACVAAISIVGDLLESWVKRCAGVKDSGALLPGHGGILDRIDGVIAGMPVAALFIKYGS